MSSFRLTQVIIGYRMRPISPLVLWSATVFSALAMMMGPSGSALAADAFTPAPAGGAATKTGSGAGTGAGARTVNGTIKEAVTSQIADGLDAQMRVSDALWLDRELTRFCAALGRDPKPLRRYLAEQLYHTRTLDAIDTARPALFIWRKGPAPLQAIIPILADKRRQFVEEFGVMGGGEAPLVRVGDRDGTVVYTQNHPDGLREYRLLVTDSVAFLARNGDECRKLAARAATMLPLVGSGVAPVSLTCTGDWLRARDLLAWSWTPRLPLHWWLPTGAILDAAQSATLKQVDSMSFEVRPGAGGKARLAVRATAIPDSELAAWIATQQNQGNRFKAQGGPETAIRIASHVMWQDKLGQLAQALAPAQRQALGATWTTATDEAWNQVFSVAERVVDAAWTLDVPVPGSQVQMLVLEQPRGEEQTQALDRVAATYLGVPATQRAVTGFQAALRTVPAAGASPSLIQLLCATTRHTLIVDAWNVTEAEVLAGTEATARSLQQVAPVTAEPSIVSVWCNLGRLVRLAPGIDTELTIADAIISGALRTAGVNTIQFDLNVPLIESAQALGHLPDETREGKKKK